MAEEWRDKPISAKQIFFLLDHGIDEEAIPDTQGEASVLIDPIIRELADKVWPENIDLMRRKLSVQRQWCPFCGQRSLNLSNDDHGYETSILVRCRNSWCKVAEFEITRPIGAPKQR